MSIYDVFPIPLPLVVTLQHTQHCCIMHNTANSVAGLACKPAIAERNAPRVLAQ